MFVSDRETELLKKVVKSSMFSTCCQLVERACEETVRSMSLGNSQRSLISGKTAFRSPMTILPLVPFSCSTPYGSGEASKRPIINLRISLQRMGSDFRTTFVGHFSRIPRIFLRRSWIISSSASASLSKLVRGKSMVPTMRLRPLLPKIKREKKIAI